MKVNSGSHSYSSYWTMSIQISIVSSLKTIPRPITTPLTAPTPRILIITETTTRSTCDSILVAPSCLLYHGSFCASQLWQPSRIYVNMSRKRFSTISIGSARLISTSTRQTTQLSSAKITPWSSSTCFTGATWVLFVHVFPLTVFHADLSHAAPLLVPR